MNARLIALLAIFQNMMDTYQIPTGGQVEIAFKGAMVELSNLVELSAQPVANVIETTATAAQVDFAPITDRLSNIETAVAGLLAHITTPAAPAV